MLEVGFETNGSVLCERTLKSRWNMPVRASSIAILETGNGGPSYRQCEVITACWRPYSGSESGLDALQCKTFFEWGRNSGCEKAVILSDDGLSVLRFVPDQRPELLACLRHVAIFFQRFHEQLEENKRLQRSHIAATNQLNLEIELQRQENTRLQVSHAALVGEMEREITSLKQQNTKLEKEKSDAVQRWTEAQSQAVVLMERNAKLRVFRNTYRQQLRGIRRICMGSKRQRCQSNAAQKVSLPVLEESVVASGHSNVSQESPFIRTVIDS